MTTTMNQTSTVPESGSPDPADDFSLRSLPPLWQPLHKLALRSRWQSFWRCLFYTLTTGLLGLLFLVVVQWRYPTLPLNFNITLWGIYWLTLIYLFFHWLKPVWRLGSVDHAITRAEQTSPILQERLSSVVELLSEPDPRFRGSPELIAQLIAEAQAEAQRLNPEQVLPSRILRRGVFALIGVLFLWIFLGLLQPQLFAAPLRNALFPWQKIPQAVAATPTFPWTITPGSCQILTDDSLTIIVEPPAPTTTAPHTPLPSIRGLTIITSQAGGTTQTFSMTRTSSNAFKYQFDHIAQSFHYQIQTISTTSTQTPLESDAFAVTVTPRPELKTLSVRYDYPDYTKLPPRTDPKSDGEINTLLNTRITWTITTSQPLSTGSHLLLNPDATFQKIPLTPLATPNSNEPQYSATLLLTTPGDFLYRPVLLTSRSTTNQNQRSRKIHVFLDSPPQIKIVSPTREIHVRPTETLPIQFQAQDDFGIARIYAKVQVDQTAPEQFDLVLPPDSTQATALQGNWPLNIPALLARKNLTSAQRITYQLKTTDNAPSKVLTTAVAFAGQEGTTPTYTLILDEHATPLTPPPATAPATQPALTAEQIQKLKDLQSQLEKLAAQQQAIEQRARQRKLADQAARSPEQIAREQEKLNQDIQKYLKQEQDAGRALPSNLKPLEPKQLDEIVKNLQENKLNNAAHAQDAAARKLADTNPPATTNPASNPPTPETPEQQAARTEAIKKTQQQVDKLQRDINQFAQRKNGHTKVPDPNNETARDLANRINKQGRDLASQDATQKDAAQKIARETQAAKDAAEKGNAAEAQQHLQKASEMLRQADEKSHASPEEKQQRLSQQRESQQQAEKLMQRQRELTQKTQQAEQAREQKQERAQEAQKDADTQQQLHEQGAQTLREVCKACQKPGKSGDDNSQPSDSGIPTKPSTQQLAQGIQDIQRQLASGASQTPGGSHSQTPTSPTPSAGNPSPVNNTNTAQGPTKPGFGTTTANNGAPGNSASGGNGINTNTPSTFTRAVPTTPPPSDLPISPGAWAKLSPELQQQFLHASRQPGPPEYREMIKNYMIRISQLENHPTPPQETTP